MIDKETCGAHRDEYILAASDGEYDAIVLKLILSELLNCGVTLHLTAFERKLALRLLELGRAKIQRMQFAIEDRA